MQELGPRMLGVIQKYSRGVGVVDEVFLRFETLFLIKCNLVGLIISH
jgi:hypothetical protein